MTTKPGYLTKNEAARTLGVSRRTLDRHIKKSEMSTFRFLGAPTIYVQESDIKKLLHPTRKAN